MKTNYKKTIALLLVISSSNTYAQTVFTSSGGVNTITVGGVDVGSWSITNNSGSDWTSVSAIGNTGDNGIRVGGVNDVANSTQALDVTINYNLTGAAYGIVGSQSWGAGNGSMFGPQGMGLTPDADIVGNAFGPSGVLSDTSNRWNEADGATVSALSSPAGTRFVQSVGLWDVSTPGFQNSYSVGYFWDPSDDTLGPGIELMTVRANFAVPEPSSVALLGFGAFGFLLRKKR